MLKYLIGGMGGIFALIVLIYVAISKKMQTKETKYARQLVSGTQSTALSFDVFLQKFYITCTKNYCYTFNNRSYIYDTQQLFSNVLNFII